MQMNKCCHSSSIKMTAPLGTCTEEEQRSVIRFLTREGVKPIEIHCRMRAKNLCGTLKEKVMISLLDSLLGMKHGSTTKSRKQRERAWNDIILHPQNQ
jgi:hypothetical protein